MHYPVLPQIRGTRWIETLQLRNGGNRGCLPGLKLTTTSTQDSATGSGSHRHQTLPGFDPEVTADLLAVATPIGTQAHGSINSR